MALILEKGLPSFATFSPGLFRARAFCSVSLKQARAHEPKPRLVPPLGAAIKLNPDSAGTGMGFGALLLLITIIHFIINLKAATDIYTTIQLQVRVLLQRSLSVRGRSSRVVLGAAIER